MDLFLIYEKLLFKNAFHSKPLIKLQSTNKLTATFHVIRHTLSLRLVPTNRNKDIWQLWFNILKESMKAMIVVKNN